MVRYIIKWFYLWRIHRLSKLTHKAYKKLKLLDSPNSINTVIFYADLITVYALHIEFINRHLLTTYVIGNRDERDCTIVHRVLTKLLEGNDLDRK